MSTEFEKFIRKNRNDFDDGVPSDKVWKEIKDIKPGSNIILLTWLHQADRSVIKCVPRRNYDAPEIGVFSTRSPDRPNPIGLHSVKILSVKRNLLKVSALEVLDQTPLLDVKPDLT